MVPSPNTSAHAGITVLSRLTDKRCDTDSLHGRTSRAYPPQPKDYRPRQSRTCLSNAHVDRQQVDNALHAFRPAPQPRGMLVSGEGPSTRTEMARPSARSHASNAGFTRSRTAKSSSVETWASIMAPRGMGYAQTSKVASGKWARIFVHR